MGESGCRAPTGPPQLRFRSDEKGGLSHPDLILRPILAERTRILAARDVPRVRTATDLGNVSMARAFARAGYAVFEHQIGMVRPAEEVP